MGRQHHHTWAPSMSQLSSPGRMSLPSSPALQRQPGRMSLPASPALQLPPQLMLNAQQHAQQHALLNPAPSAAGQRLAQLRRSSDSAGAVAARPQQPAGRWSGGGAAGEGFLPAAASPTSPPQLQPALRWRAEMERLQAQAGASGEGYLPSEAPPNAQRAAEAVAAAAARQLREQQVARARVVGSHLARAGFAGEGLGADLPLLPARGAAPTPQPAAAPHQAPGAWQDGWAQQSAAAAQTLAASGRLPAHYQPAAAAAAAHHAQHPPAQAVAAVGGDAPAPPAADPLMALAQEMLTENILAAMPRSMRDVADIAMEDAAWARRDQAARRHGGSSTGGGAPQPTGGPPKSSAAPAACQGRAPGPGVPRPPPRGVQLLARDAGFMRKLLAQLPGVDPGRACVVGAVAALQGCGTQPSSCP